MKIRPEIEVFSDAEYCESTEHGIECQFAGVLDKKSYCVLFGDFLEIKPCLSKCDQCKVDYLKAKREEPTDRKAYLLDMY